MQKLTFLPEKQSFPTSRSILQQKDPTDTVHNNYVVAPMDKVVH